MVKQRTNEPAMAVTRTLRPRTKPAAQETIVIEESKPLTKTIRGTKVESKSLKTKNTDVKIKKPTGHSTVTKTKRVSDANSETDMKPEGRKSATPKKQMSEIDKILLEMKKADERRKKMPSAEELKQLRTDMRGTIDRAKTAMEDLERKKAVAKPKSTRSGLKRGSGQKKLEASTNGNIVNKGMDDVDETFDKEEQEYLHKRVRKVPEVKDLKYDDLRYLIKYEFLDDLKAIRDGKIKSKFHDLFNDPNISKDDLRARVRTSLFTNDQRDYIIGLLQGVFEANKKDGEGNLRHREMDYVSIVMLFETVIKIVQLVHDIEGRQETLSYMKKKSRDVLGISDSESEGELDL